MFGPFLSLDRRRELALRRTSEGPLAHYLSTPFPHGNTPAREVPYVAVDLETTGLDPSRDEIVAIGLVHVNEGMVHLGSAHRWLVPPTRAIPEKSAVIHKITDDQAAAGSPLAQAMAEALPLMAGRVLIAHYARVELQFLRAACQRLYGGRFIIPAVDTHAIARQRLDRRNAVYTAKDLQLAELRKAYNLPRYRAHDALSDALAAAELFLAQLAERDGEEGVPLKGFVKTVSRGIFERVFRG